MDCEEHCKHNIGKLLQQKMSRISKRPNEQLNSLLDHQLHRHCSLCPNVVMNQGCVGDKANNGIYMYEEVYLSNQLDRSMVLCAGGTEA